MNYSSFLQMQEELSLLVVIVILLIYDIFAGEKSLRFFQPIAIVLFAIHTLLNCMPHKAFEIAGGMSAGFARTDPFGMMSNGIGNGGCRWHESDKIFFGQQFVMLVTR